MSDHKLDWFIYIMFGVFAILTVVSGAALFVVPPQKIMLAFWGFLVGVCGMIGIGKLGLALGSFNSGE